MAVASGSVSLVIGGRITFVKYLLITLCSVSFSCGSGDTSLSLSSTMWRGYTRVLVMFLEDALLADWAGAYACLSLLIGESTLLLVLLLGVCTLSASSSRVKFFIDSTCF